MIQGKQIKQQNTITRPDVNYRAIKSLNCSMIKLFDQDPIKFFEEYKMGKAKKDKKSTALLIGDMVDFYLLDCKGDYEEFTARFDEKFALFEGTKGSGQVFILCDILFEVTQEDTQDGVVKTDFATRFSEACRKVQAQDKYKKATEEKILADFEANGLQYFQTLLDNVGKSVVDISLVDKAKKVAELLKTDEFTKDLFDSDTDDVEHFPKHVIEWEYMSIDCKSELDLIIVDHKNKVIYPKDLKTTYDNENFEYGYLKYRYDLQAAFYRMAVTYWAEENGMTDYRIDHMEFIVADTSYNNRRPIRFQTSKDDFEQSYSGFSVRGNKYKGLEEIVYEIIWAEESGNWNVSKDVFDNKGILPLSLKYDEIQVPVYKASKFSENPDMEIG